MSTATIAAFDVAAQPHERVVCALCGENKKDTIALEDRYGLPVRVVRCRACGLRYLNPRMTAEGYAAFYTHGYRPLLEAHLGRPYSLAEIESDQWQYAAELSAVAAPYVPLGGRLLDLGGSTGIVARLFAARFGTTGTVVDPAADELARATGCVTMCSPAESATFPPTSFDVIVCARTLDHLLDPLGVLTRARAWVKLDGVLVVDVMNVSKWPQGHQYKVDHPYAFTAKTFEALVVKAGWTPLTKWQRQEHRYLGMVCHA